MHFHVSKNKETKTNKTMKPWKVHFHMQLHMILCIQLDIQFVFPVNLDCHLGVLDMSLNDSLFCTIAWKGEFII